MLNQTTKMRLITCITIIFTITALLSIPVSASPTMLTDLYGGTEWDADKDFDGNDENLCWAAQASNMLAWSGWGMTDGMTTEDDIFGHFKENWPNNGGNAHSGFEWWFQGHDDIDGGGFYPEEDHTDYYSNYFDTDQALTHVDDYITSGQTTGITITDGDARHAVTAWGFEESSGDYTDIFITDSDDHYDGTEEYSLNYDETNERWYLDDYIATGDWYIDEVIAFETIPEPTTLLLMLIASILLLSRRRKLMQYD